MAREVVWTEPAWEDLVAADYIARDSVSYARKFVQEIKEATVSLAEFVSVAAFSRRSVAER
jgi:plasmid stabilization system protein ParE